MKKSHIIKLVSSLLLVLLVGFLGSFFTSSSVNGWYQTINKPSFNPPSWIFGPVWTILYIMIGISLYLVWTKPSKKSKKPAYIAFAIQLGLNFLWSILFFGNQNPAGAFIDIILLWLAILANIILVYKISKPAAYLLVPYWLWVSFASILNFTIWILNN